LQDVLEPLASTIDSKPAELVENTEFAAPLEADEDNKPTEVKLGAIDLSVAVEKAGDAPPTTEVIPIDSDRPERKSPSALVKTSETRQFQKTRSFSAVEDTPKKKILNIDTHELKDFPFKDVAHSRSDQLAMQQQQQGATEDDDATPMNSRTCLLVNKNDDCNQTDGAVTKQTSKQPFIGGETLIMQFDYDQPMSLQHDSSYNQTIDECDSSSLREGGRGNHRKSGRDLTEFESTRDRFEKTTKSGRSNSSRPRLEFITTHSLLKIYSLSILCFSLLSCMSFNQIP
jgi:hypothetical protein